MSTTEYASPDTESLRQRKRRQTQAAIEEHATMLVAERGFTNVKVEDICTAVQISKRTFFNYVESKEQAVLGPPPQAPSEQQRSEFLNSSHSDVSEKLLLIAVHNLVARHAVTGEKQNELVRRRKIIRRQNPELDQQALTLLTAYFASIQDLACEYFTKYPDTRVLGSQVGADGEAEVLALIITSAIRGGYNRWLESPKGNADDLKKHCLTSLEQIKLMITRNNAVES